MLCAAGLKWHRKGQSIYCFHRKNLRWILASKTRAVFYITAFIIFCCWPELHSSRGFADTIWVVLLVTTLQILSSSACGVVRKAYSSVLLLCWGSGSHWDMQEAESKDRWSQRECFQKTQDKERCWRIPQLPQLHVLSSQQQLRLWLMFTQLENTRAGYPFASQKLSFLCYFLYFLCRSSIRGQNCTVWDATFLGLLIFACLRTAELLWPLGKRADAFTKHCYL